MIDLETYKKLLIINGYSFNNNYPSAINVVLKKESINISELYTNIDYYIDLYKDGDRSNIDSAAHRLYSNSLIKYKEYSKEDYSYIFKIKFYSSDYIPVNLLSKIIELDNNIIEIGKKDNNKFNIRLLEVKSGCFEFLFSYEFINTALSVLSLLVNIGALVFAIKSASKKDNPLPPDISKLIKSFLKELQKEGISEIEVKTSKKKYKLSIKSK